MPHRHDGHRQAAPPPKPVVHRRNGGVVVAGAEADRHQPDKDQQEKEVVSGLGQQDKAQAGQDAAESQHNPRAVAVGKVADNGALNAAHQPAEGVSPADGGGAQPQIVLNGNDIDGKAPVKAALLDAVGDQADQDNPPPVENPGRTPQQTLPCRWF